MLGRDQGTTNDWGPGFTLNPLVPTHTLVGSLISAAYLPQGRCRTPRYLTLPVATLLPVEKALREAPGEALFLTPSPDFLWLWAGFCSWLDSEEDLWDVQAVHQCRPRAGRGGGHGLRRARR